MRMKICVSLHGSQCKISLVTLHSDCKSSRWRRGLKSLMKAEDKGKRTLPSCQIKFWVSLREINSMGEEGHCVADLAFLGPEDTERRSSMVSFTGDWTLRRSPKEKQRITSWAVIWEDSGDVVWLNQSSQTSWAKGEKYLCLCGFQLNP